MSHFWHFNDHKARSKHETYITDPVLPIYSLRSIRWYISLLHFKTFKVQFNAPPVLFPIRYQYGLNPINYWLELSIFPNSGERKSEKLGSCIKPRLYFQIIYNSLKSWEIGIWHFSHWFHSFSDCKDSLSHRRRNQLKSKLPVFKNNKWII